MTEPVEKFYVHYTALDPAGPRNLVAGPYTASEAIDRRRELSLSPSCGPKCFIDESPVPLT